jgi:hypothetical protein
MTFSLVYRLFWLGVVLLALIVGLLVGIGAFSVGGAVAACGGVVVLGATLFVAGREGGLDS